MSETGISLPLSERLLAGSRPPAPQWFTDALAHQPERLMIEAAGVAIETLIWGERGRPGLFFLHGNGAHADWWSFIAPFFASRYRVAAMSWSGMGGSGRRSLYSLDLHLQEAMAIADLTGLFEGPVKPSFIGHSFGGFPSIAAAAQHGERLARIILVDTPIFSPERRKRRQKERGDPVFRPHRVYETMQEGLDRFRFIPPQPFTNPFIVDHIARKSLIEVEGGWTWRFDPFLWRGYERGESGPMLAASQCPLHLIFGADSTLMSEEDQAYMLSVLPVGTPIDSIPDAGHHVMVDQPLALVEALKLALG